MQFSKQDGVLKTLVKFEENWGKLFLKMICDHFGQMEMGGENPLVFFNDEMGQSKSSIPTYKNLCLSLYISLSFVHGD